MRKITAILVIVFSSVFCSSAQSKPLDVIVKAQSHYFSGDYLSAIELWRESLQELQDEKEIAKINLQIGHAQRSLGFPVRACQSYTSVLRISAEICKFKGDDEIRIQVNGTDAEAQAIISMANLLRDVGQFSQAGKFIEFGLSNAQQINESRLEAAAQLSRGKLIVDQLKLKRDRLKYQNIQGISSDEGVKVEKSFFDAYQATEFAVQSPFKVNAIIQWFELYEEHRQWQPLLKSSEFKKHQASIYQYLSELNLNQIPESQIFQKGKLYLKTAQIFQKLAAENSSYDYIRLAFDANLESLKIAKSIDNELLISSAYGQLGKIYKSTGQLNEALKALDLGIQFANSLGNEELLYKWHRERAEIYKITGNKSAALLDYEIAVEKIQALEVKITWLPSELRTEFQSKVRPVFDSYLSSLLSQPHPEFKRVFQVQDQFNRTLLQNYLGCSTLENISLTDISNSSDETIISIIKAGNNYHTIASNQGVISYSRSEAPEIDRLLQQTSLLIREDTTPPESILRQQFQILYQKLLEPVITNIPISSTLLFRSLEPTLQQLPTALLYDGQSFLIEKYSIASIGNAIYEPKKLDIENSDILFAGISRPENFSNFSDLPFVKAEKESIKPETALVNQKFTKERFLERLRAGASIVHIASHGKFSSSPNETFLLAWDGKITLDTIGSVVSDRALNTAQPIELLVLSACETAKGDPSASLGLAGIVVQSGARSTLASLWRVDDQSAAMLMNDFYKFLREGRSKAESLRLAQIEQIKQGRSPYNWGNFILIGSWI